MNTDSVIIGRGHCLNPNCQERLPNSNFFCDYCRKKKDVFERLYYFKNSPIYLYNAKNKGSRKEKVVKKTKKKSKK